jgi:hypothetical protein
MDKIIGTFHNITTGVVEVRELTTEELEVYYANVAAQEAEAEAQASAAEARAALLERLGITEEEAQLLLGGN